MSTRITTLTSEQRERMTEWADRWIDIGLRTGPADRERFEAAVRKCYGFVDIPWHGNVVWVSSPLVGALAAPIAARLINDRAVHGAVSGAVSDAVDIAVGGMIHD